jgi:hypothetical protein
MSDSYDEEDDFARLDDTITPKQNIAKGMPTNFGKIDRIQSNEESGFEQSEIKDENRQIRRNQYQADSVS